MKRYWLLKITTFPGWEPVETLAVIATERDDAQIADPQSDLMDASEMFDIPERAVDGISFSPPYLFCGHLNISQFECRERGGRKYYLIPKESRGR